MAVRQQQTGKVLGTAGHVFEILSEMQEVVTAAKRPAHEQDRLLKRVHELSGGGWSVQSRENAAATVAEAEKELEEFRASGGDPRRLTEVEIEKEKKQKQLQDTLDKARPVPLQIAQMDGNSSSVGQLLGGSTISDVRQKIDAQGGRFGVGVGATYSLFVHGLEDALGPDVELRRLFPSPCLPSGQTSTLFLLQQAGQYWGTVSEEGTISGNSQQVARSSGSEIRATGGTPVAQGRHYWEVEVHEENTRTKKMSSGPHLQRSASSSPTRTAPRAIFILLCFGSARMTGSACSLTKVIRAGRCGSTSTACAMEMNSRACKGHSQSVVSLVAELRKLRNH